MTSNEIERATGALALTQSQHEWTVAQRAALDQLGLRDAPDGDLAVFLHYSQRTRLDPFTKQIYMIGRWDGRTQRNKYTIQAGIDGLRLVAERHGQYGGQDGPYWCGKDGQWVDVWVSNEPPVAAKVGVVRKDWTKPVYAVAKFGEYAARNKDGGLQGLWKTMPCGQIAKCAEALSLRKAFPQDLSGIYTAEEMGQADNPPLRVVIDQASDDVEAAAEVDWDAEIASCGNDVGALRELWLRANRLGASAAKAKIAAKVIEIQSVVVDAEVVDEPKPAQRRPSKAEAAQAASAMFDELLACGDIGRAEEIAKQAPRQEVSGFLRPKQDVCEILDVRPDEKIMLPDLAQLVADYINKHGHSVNSALDGDIADVVA